MAVECRPGTSVPPCELKRMSFLTPLRATASPMSVHTAVSVLALSDMVPGLGPGI